MRRHNGTHRLIQPRIQGLIREDNTIIVDPRIKNALRETADALNVSPSWLGATLLADCLRINLDAKVRAYNDGAVARKQALRRSPQERRDK